MSKKVIKSLFRRWWEDYPSLNSAKFTIESSGNMQYEPCPYQLDYDIDKLIPAYYTKDWKPIGYTLHPPETYGQRKCVAIMFERDNGEQAWFHFPIFEDIDYE